MKTKLKHSIMRTNRKSLATLVAVATGLGIYSAALAVNDPLPVPGCDVDNTCKGSCGETLPAGSPDCVSSSFNYSLNIGYARLQKEANFLGQARAGAISGQGGRGYYRDFDALRSEIFNSNNVTDRSMETLNISEPEITRDLYDPSILEYTPVAGATYIEDDGHLRQVLTESLLTEITKNDDGYTIEMWSVLGMGDLEKEGKLFKAPDTDPISTVIFSNPNHPASEGRLLLSTSENFSGEAPLKITRLYDQSDRDREVVRYYEGLITEDTENIEIPQKLEKLPLLSETTLVYKDRGARPWDYTFERTKKVASNIDGELGELVLYSKVREIHEDFSIAEEGGGSNGKRLMSRTVGFDTDDENTTTFTYYSDTNNRFQNGRLKSTQHPDGSWEYCEYTDAEGVSTAIETKYKSWKDVPLANFTQGIKEETIITETGATRTTSINGQQIAQMRYTAEENQDAGELTYSESRWTGSEWATKSTTYAASSADEATANRPVYCRNADGTVIHYEYALSTDGEDEVTVTKTEGGGDENGVTAGTKTITTYNCMNQITYEEIQDVETGLQLTTRMGSNFDDIGRAQRWTYNGVEGDFELMEYGCCGLKFSQDRYGATKTFFRDNLKRVYRVIAQSSSTDTPVYITADHNGLTTTTQRTADGTTLLVSEGTRTLGGLTRTSLAPDSNGDSTPETTIRQTVYKPEGGSIRTTTHPDGTITASSTYIDGSTKTSTDQLGFITSMDKGTHAEQGGGLWQRTTLANGTQFTTTFADHLGRTFRSENADGTYRTMTYNDFSTAEPGGMGKLFETRDEDENVQPGTGSRMTYNYCTEGHRCTTVSFLPGGQTLTSITDHDGIADPDTGNSMYSWTEVNGIITNRSFRSGDGYRTKTITLAGTSTSIRTIPNDGAWTVTSTNADGQVTIQTYTDGLMEKTELFDNADSPELIASTIYTYDAFDRPLSTNDSRTALTTINGYLENGAITSMTTNGGADTTSYTYDTMGRILSTTLPDGTITYSSYTGRGGEMLATWGSLTYSRLYQYDELGRMIELRTYQSLPHGTEPTVAKAGFASTTWVYQLERGFLTEKNYDGEVANGANTADYTYTPAGRLATRTWERGVLTSYSYDQGKLSSIAYTNDPTDTLDVIYTYDDFGRKSTVSQGGNLHTYGYSPTTLVLTSETISYDTNGDGSPDLTRVLNRTQDSILRPSGCSLIDGNTSEQAVSYSYDTAGRLHTVGNNSNTFTYGYTPNSYNLLATLTGPVHTVTNTYEPTRNALANKQNKINSNASIASNYAYTVNSIGQRTNLATTGTAFSSDVALAWSYNARGELVTADHSDSAQDRAFQYDGIGNRQKAANSLILPAFNNYTVNSLNQNTAVAGLPIRTHDTDGNLTSGALPADQSGNSTLIWDAENRLVAVTKPDNTIIRFRYDYQSRRISKATDGSPATRYIYDGWNMVAEYTEVTLAKTYTWGFDLSGSSQGAGGVGGLLSAQEFDNQKASFTTHYPTYDGNGNVSEYLDATGTTVAHYEYDSFGNATVSNGLRAGGFEYKFSTKLEDEETGLYYYGYRYYGPVTGRWPSRDPIGERGGLNMYTFASNDGVNRWDLWGLFDPDDPDSPQGPGSPNTTSYCKNSAHADISDLKIDWKIISIDKDIPISEALNELGEHLGIKILEIPIWYNAKGSVKVQCRQSCRCYDQNTGLLISRSSKILGSTTINVDETGSFTLPIAVSPTWTLKIIKATITGLTIQPYVEAAIDIQRIADQFCQTVF